MGLFREHCCAILYLTAILLIGVNAALWRGGMSKDEPEKATGTDPHSRTHGREGGTRRFQDQPRRKAARNYDNVDPTFKATLQGSMSWGEAQVETEGTLAGHVHGRLEILMRGTKTEECRKEVSEAFKWYVGAQVLERSLPFEIDRFFSQCRDPDMPTPPPEGKGLEPDDIRLAYVLLVHESPQQVIRLINALDETDHGGTWFVVHVDAKAELMQQEVLSAMEGRPNVIVMTEKRLSVSWGGFNVVQATLNAIELAVEREIPFHWLWILSGTTYPIASNREIRAKLAGFPPDSIFMESRTPPHHPASTAWHYFVECDNALHRIGRNVLPRDLSMYVGSQWMAMPPSLVHWLLEDKNLVPRYKRYAQHIVVADENFFPTLIRNSPLCGNHINNNMVHVQFDKYEHTKNQSERMLEKCLMPNPDHCGRSPAFMTLDYLSVLEHSGMLFARKFAAEETSIIDALDRVRSDNYPWRKGPSFPFVSIVQDEQQVGLSVAERGGKGLGQGQGEPESGREGLRMGSDGSEQDEGEGETGGRELCLSMGDPGKGEVAEMHLCEEFDDTQVLVLGPCGSDGDLGIPAEGGFVQAKSGEVTGRVPSCAVITIMGSCMDLLGEGREPGAPAIPYKCHNRWNQFFSFGSGVLEGHILSFIPKHLVMVSEMKEDVLCLETVLDARKEKKVVRTAVCDPSRLSQKFLVKKVSAPPSYSGSSTSDDGQQEVGEKAETELVLAERETEARAGKGVGIAKRGGLASAEGEGGSGVYRGSGGAGSDTGGGDGGLVSQHCLVGDDGCNAPNPAPSNVEPQ